MNLEIRVHDEVSVKDLFTTPSVVKPILFCYIINLVDLETPSWSAYSPRGPDANLVLIKAAF